ncbi:endophilin-B1-like isoform X3 [Paramuricea clavata]|nr:endophilin-B1-like isoform X3 [Paramuricea clavata]
MAGNLSMNDVADSWKKFAKMSVTTFSRAKQLTEEKLNRAEKTEFDAHFENLVARAEKTRDCTAKISARTSSLIQPNPNARLEDFMYQKFDGRKKERQTNYELLGQCMFDAGNELGPGTAYGGSLVECGKSLRKIGQAERDLLEKTVSRFMNPLENFLETDIKTIMKEKRVLLAKRLDLDASRTRLKKAENQSPEKVQQLEADLRVAQAEFDRQYEVTKLLLDGVTTAQNSHLIALQSFVEAQAQYFDQCHKTMVELQRHIQSGTGATGRSSSSFASMSKAPPYNISKPSTTLDIHTVTKPSVTHKAKVLYDYDAAEDDELSLLADEVIIVYTIPGLDSDWMIAERGSQKGRVPITYIELLP